MIFIPKMAFLNLTRYKKRTVITASAIAYGLLMFIVVRSLLLGIDTESTTNLRRYETASGRIMVSGYWENRETFPLGKSFDPENLDVILKDSGAEYSPRIIFAGNLILDKNFFSEEGSLPGRFTAIDPVRDVLKIRDGLVKGRWLRENEQGLLMGQWLADDINAEPGHKVQVAAQNKKGEIRRFDLEVVGIINCPNPEITRSGMFLPLQTANDYLEMGGTVTEVNLNFGTRDSDDEKFDLLVPLVQELGFEALNWRVLGQDFIAMSSAKSGATAMIIFLILVIAAVGISNTMLMAVYERVRELGMMRALGMNNRQIRALFLWESGGIGLLGAVLGVGMAVVVNWPLVRFGMDYSFLMRDSNLGYRIQGKLYGVWDFPTMIFAFFMGLGMAVLVAAFSTHRILRLDIPSSLRFH